MSVLLCLGILTHTGGSVHVVEGANAEDKGEEGWRQKLHQILRPPLVFPSYRPVGFPSASTCWRPRSRRLGKAERNASAEALSSSSMEFEGKLTLWEVKPPELRARRQEERVGQWLEVEKEDESGKAGQSTPGGGNVRDGGSEARRGPWQLHRRRGLSQGSSPL